MGSRQSATQRSWAMVKKSLHRNQYKSYERSKTRIPETSPSHILQYPQSFLFLLSANTLTHINKSVYHVNYTGKVLPSSIQQNRPLARARTPTFLPSTGVLVAPPNATCLTPFKHLHFDYISLTQSFFLAST